MTALRPSIQEGCTLAALRYVNAMMTKDEAKRALETELRSRKLAKPMTLEELNVFCEEITTAGIQIPQRTARRHPEMGQGLAV